MSQGFSTMGNPMELSDFASELIGTSFCVNNTKIGNCTKFKGKLDVKVSRVFSTMGNPVVT